MNQEVVEKLKKRAEEGDRTVLKSIELKSLFDELKILPNDQKADYGKQLNQLRQELVNLLGQEKVEDLRPSIDVTSIMDINQPKPELLSFDQGSLHPLTQEIEHLCNIFQRMGYNVEESREIDNQFNMFEALNFPKDHPARDDYDTFMTEEKDDNGVRLIAPAHTSTMQNRLLRKYAANLEKGEPIAVVVPDRVFRNEDLDARHEHTFYQIEGIFVSENVTVGNLIATLQTFLEEYYAKKLNVRVNPFYFPFTEPSFEFALSCPFCEHGCSVCSGEKWIELLGCGLIHPNVLKNASIDSNKYSGFAFGCGIDRLVMMKQNIEDVRHFESAKLDFLKQF